MFPVGHHPGELDLKMRGGTRHSVGTVLDTEKKIPLAFLSKCTFSVKEFRKIMRTLSGLYRR
jgi:hypothetical protein